MIFANSNAMDKKKWLMKKEKKVGNNQPIVPADSEESKSKNNKFTKIEAYINKHFQIRLNCITNEIEFRKIGEKSYTALNENSLYRLLQHARIKCNMNDLIILLRSDFVEKYNPILDYFTCLPIWNKKVDYILDFTKYVKAVNQERFSRHFKKMLVRTIACALNPKVVNKQAFITVNSVQNSGKSSWLRYLCPPKLNYYYTENFNLNSKDGLITLCENFLINLDELAAMGNAQINNIKAIMSQESLKIRHPYDRKSKSQPRICSFIGSTNQSEFLTDETGNVRWLCFEIESIDWNYTKIPIDNVWSQAYFLYKSGFPYQLTNEEIKENEHNNKSFIINTKEMEMVMKYVLPGTKADHEIFASSLDIINYIQGKHFSNANLNLSEMKMGKALRILNFPRESKFNGTYSVKGYYIKFIS